jgi:hypothetical protein
LVEPVECKKLPDPVRANEGEHTGRGHEEDESGALFSGSNAGARARWVRRFRSQGSRATFLRLVANPVMGSFAKRLIGNDDLKTRDIVTR